MDPPVQLFEYGTMTETAYVIVANLPAGEKHDELTTVIAASGHGTLFGRYYDTGDAAGAEIGPRLVGKHDHKRVLSALQGGYLVDTTATRKRGKHNKSRKLNKRKR